MNEQIKVLGLRIDNYSAKDAVKQVMSYFGTEPVNVVEMVTMNTIAQLQQDETAEELFDAIDIALAGDKGILQAAGVKDERHLKEIGELLFIKMIMRVLHKNSTKVFLIADDIADLHKLEVYMQEDYANIQVIGTATMEESSISDDKLLNLVNGAEADCILSALSSPTEEYFICRNKLLVNARVWLGLGDMLDQLKKEKSLFEKVKEFILRQILKKEMEKKGGNA